MENISTVSGLEITAIVISVLAFVVSVIPVIILLRERAEKFDPQLVVSFEIIRSSLACVVLKNTGQVPLALSSLKFQEDWLNAVNSHGNLNELLTLKETCVVVHPEQQHVISFSANHFELPKDKSLLIEYKYHKLPKTNKTKIITDKIEFDPKQYDLFLLYKSDIDELNKMLKDKLSGIEKLLKISKRPEQ